MIQHAISTRREFVGEHIHGGRADPDRWPVTGRLNQDWVDALCHEKPTYIVYSYGTPIAWYSWLTGWTMPEVEYSATTCKHQKIVRAAMPGTSAARTSL